MKSSLLATAATAVLWMATSASGQGLKVDIPFEFTAGNKTLSSGTYLFERAPGGRALEVRTHQRERASIPIVTTLAHSSPFDDSRVVFDQVGDEKRLAEVWIDGSEGLLLQATYEGHRHVVLHLIDPPLRNLSGKAAFEATCLRCHGKRGNGDAIADKFFKMTLPRLNSDYVQRKTDEEIRTVITRGHGKMDPARIGTGKKHLLPEESVDAVIKHVRTLNKP